LGLYVAYKLVIAKPLLTFDPSGAPMIKATLS